jgi:hypothetical protein
VKIAITFEFTPEHRHILARKDGAPGLASREQMKRFAHSIVYAALSDYEAELPEEGDDA